jgi:hypothetical protein
MLTILSLVTPTLGKLLDAILPPHDVAHSPFRSAEDLRRALIESKTMTPTVIVDLQALRLLPQLATSTVRSIARLPCAPRILLIAGNTQTVYPEDVRWFTSVGAVDLLPQASAARWNATCLPLFRAISATLGESLNSRRLAPMLRTFAESYEKGTPAAEIALAENIGVTVTELANAMRAADGVDIADRTYHLRGYAECFVASAAVGWLSKRYGVDREAAVSMGAAMQRAGLIYHVTREQSFADAELFFRLGRYPAQFAWPQLLERFFSASGPEVKDRTYRAKTYPHTFVGSEAANWFSKAGFSINEAMTIGQRMIDLSIMHHVVDEQPFRDGDFFYRAYIHDVPKTVQTGASRSTQRFAAAR